MRFAINIFGTDIICGTRPASDVFPEDNVGRFICYAGDWNFYGLGATHLEALADFIYHNATNIISKKNDEAYGDYMQEQYEDYQAGFTGENEEWSHEDIRDYEQTMNDNRRY